MLVFIDGAKNQFMTTLAAANFFAVKSFCHYGA